MSNFILLYFCTEEPIDFVVKVAAMSLEIENETWRPLGFCSFCSKIFHSNVSSESPDNSKRSEEYSPLFFFPPIITTPFSVGEEIIVDIPSANGSLGPRIFLKYLYYFHEYFKNTILFHTHFPSLIRAGSV